MNNSSVIPPVKSPSDLPATPASGQSGFASTETQAQLYIEIFNNFLLSDSKPASPLTAPGASTNNLLMQLLNSQPASRTSDGKLMTDSLGEIGIGFEQSSAPASILNSTGQLTLDTAKLESAFSADPSGTQAAVSQAVQSIGQLSAKFSSTFVPDFSASSSTSSLFGGQSNAGGFLSGFDTSSDTSSVWDTLSLNPQLTAAQMLGTFNTGGATSLSLASLFAQGGSTASDFLGAFSTGSDTPSIWDTFSQNPQLIAAQVLGTLPALPTTQKT